MSAVKARVLLVGGPPSQVRLVCETLATATGGIYEVSHASRLADALPQLAGNDVVLLESLLADAAPAAAVERVTSAAPGVGLVLLVRPPDAELGRQALESGADAVVVKDQFWELDCGRLIRAIDKALAAHRPAPADPPAMERRPRGAVLSVIGAKGGVATTSIALRLSRALAERGKRTALIELRTWAGTLAGLLSVRPASHLGQVLSMEPAALVPQVFDELLAGVAPNLKVLLAPPEPVDPDLLSAERAHATLESLTRIAQRVVLDLPCACTPALPVVARASSFIALVVEAESGCLRQARGVVELLRSFSVGAARIGAVVVYRTPALDYTLQDLRDTLGCDVLATLPVPPGCRVATRDGEDPGLVSASGALGLGVEGLVDRLDTANALPLRFGPISPT